VPIDMVPESHHIQRAWTPARPPSDPDIMMDNLCAGRLGRQAFSCPWATDTTFGDPLAICRGDVVGLVALRNPWSHCEWNGKWSDEDAEVWTYDVQNLTGHVLTEDNNDGL